MQQFVVFLREIAQKIAPKRAFSHTIDKISGNRYNKLVQIKGKQVKILRSAAAVREELRAYTTEQSGRCLSAMRLKSEYPLAT